MLLSKILEELLWGMGTSIEIFLLTLLFSIPLGLAVAAGRMSSFKPLQWFMKAYISIMRGTPLMLQLIVVFFGPYYIFGMTLSRDFRMIAVIIAFTINYAAYFAEIYRGGMNSIDKGQYEAAHALGLSKKQTMLDIILPQTMKAILPPVFNETITLVKDTALVMAIGCHELMKVTSGIVSRTSDITPFAVAAVIYLVMTFVLTLGAGKLERHFSRYDQKGE